MYDLGKVKCCMYRGGTSRGVFFHAEDVPEDFKARESMFLGIMGSPDIRQIDGLGGATSHTSKVVIVHQSNEDGIDIEYEFIQVGIDRPIIDPRGMCGNLLSAAGLFAVDEGLVTACEPETTVSVKNKTTGAKYLLRIPVKDGRTVTQGSYEIDGVARPGAPIGVEFINPGGSVTGKLLPTGNPVDRIATSRGTYTVSIVDAGHIHLFVRSKDFQIKGIEILPELQQQKDKLAELENLRGRAAVLCGFAEQPETACKQSPARPRTGLVGHPVSYASLYSRPVEAARIDIRSFTISMERFHQSIPLSTAICLAAAAAIPGTVVHDIFHLEDSDGSIRIGHPSGLIEVEVQSGSDPSAVNIRKVVARRTARRLMEGFAYFPKGN